MNSQTSSHLDLYQQWERQHWVAQEIDFSRDRADWLALTDQERWQWFWLAGFSHFRQSETAAVVCLASLLPCLPRSEQQRFLGTQIADECRHAVFFERFHREVLSAALPTVEQGSLSISPAYRALFFDLATEAVRQAVSDGSFSKLAIAAFQIFIVLEGSIALASFSVIRRLLAKTDRFPGLLAGMTHAHQDEVRHAQFGVSLLREIFAEDPSARDAVADHMRKILPLFSEVLQPRQARKDILQALGLNPLERRQRAFAHLQRHADALGMRGDVIDPWRPAA
jgi:ribonucleoside-diphosphate reductase beta chain